MFDDNQNGTESQSATVVIGGGQPHSVIEIAFDPHADVLSFGDLAASRFDVREADGSTVIHDGDQDISYVLQGVSLADLPSAGIAFSTNSSLALFQSKVADAIASDAAEVAQLAAADAAEAAAEAQLANDALSEALATATAGNDEADAAVQQALAAADSANDSANTELGFAIDAANQANDLAESALIEARDAADLANGNAQGAITEAISAADAAIGEATAIRDQAVADANAANEEAQAAVRIAEDEANSAREAAWNAAAALEGAQAELDQAFQNYEDGTGTEPDVASAKWKVQDAQYAKDVADENAQAMSAALDSAQQNAQSVAAWGDAAVSAANEALAQAAAVGSESIDAATWAAQQIAEEGANSVRIAEHEAARVRSEGQESVNAARETARGIALEGAAAVADARQIAQTVADDAAARVLDARLAADAANATAQAAQEAADHARALADDAAEAAAPAREIADNTSDLHVLIGLGEPNSTRVVAFDSEAGVIDFGNLSAKSVEVYETDGSVTIHFIDQDISYVLSGVQLTDLSPDNFVFSSNSARLAFQSKLAHAVADEAAEASRLATAHADEATALAKLASDHLKEVTADTTLAKAAANQAVTDANAAAKLANSAANAAVTEATAAAKLANDAAKAAVTEATEAAKLANDAAKAAVTEATESSKLAKDAARAALTEATEAAKLANDAARAELADATAASKTAKEVAKAAATDFTAADKVAKDTAKNYSKGLATEAQKTAAEQAAADAKLAKEQADQDVRDSDARLNSAKENVKIVAAQGTESVNLAREHVQVVAAQGTESVNLAKEHAKVVAAQGTESVNLAKENAKLVAEHGTESVNLAKENAKIVAEQGTASVNLAKEAAKAVADESAAAISEAKESSNEAAAAAKAAREAAKEASTEASNATKLAKLAEKALVDDATASANLAKAHAADAAASAKLAQEASKAVAAEAAEDEKRAKDIAKELATEATAAVKLASDAGRALTAAEKHARDVDAKFAKGLVTAADKQAAYDAVAAAAEAKAQDDEAAAIAVQAKELAAVAATEATAFAKQAKALAAEAAAVAVTYATAAREASAQATAAVQLARSTDPDVAEAALESAKLAADRAEDAAHHAADAAAHVHDAAQEALDSVEAAADDAEHAREFAHGDHSHDGETGGGDHDGEPGGDDHGGETGGDDHGGETGGDDHGGETGGDDHGGETGGDDDGDDDDGGETGGDDDDGETGSGDDDGETGGDDNGGVTPAPHPVIVGYFPEWGVYARDYFIADVPAEQLTHLVYGFLDLEQSGRVAIQDPFAALEKTMTADESVDGVPDIWGVGLAGNFNQLAKLKLAHPDLTISIAVGGWTLSQHFSDVFATAEGRTAFVASMIDFLKTYTMFDGVDFDWEFPGGGGLDGNSADPQDGQNYALLLEQMRAALDDLEATTGREYQISVATPATLDKLANFNAAGLEPFVDHFNLMAYDFHGSGYDPVTGHQSPMYDPVAHQDITTAVQQLLDIGVDPAKVVLGSPAYGRAWAGVQDGGDGGLSGISDGAPGGSFENGVYDYKDLLNKLQQPDSGWKLYWDDNAQAAYVYNEQLKIYSTFETPSTVALKADWAKSLGLGGMMFWDLSGDSATAESLVKAAYESFITGKSFSEIVSGSSIHPDVIIGGNGVFDSIVDGSTGEPGSGHGGDDHGGETGGDDHGGETGGDDHDGETGDGDGGETGDGDDHGGETGGDDHGGETGDRQGIVTAIELRDGAHATLDFKPEQDKLNFTWIDADSFGISEVDGSVVIYLPHDQTYTLEGVGLADLSLGNLVGLTGQAKVKWEVVLGEHESPATPAQEPVIVGYFPEWGVYDRNYYIADVPADQLTHLVYSFLDLKADGTVEIRDPYASLEKAILAEHSVDGVPDTWDQEGLAGSFNQLAKLKLAHPDLTISIAVGGWTLSQHFSNVFATAEGRTAFVASMIDFLKTYTMFDGVDFDWEFPGGGGLEGNSARPQDGQNYALLLEQMRTALDGLEATTGREYQISVATPAALDKLANFNAAGLEPFVDHFNLMAYDFHGTFESTTGHQSPMYDPILNQGITTGVQQLLDAGIDPAKIVLGSPAYSWAWSGVKDGGDGGWNASSDGTPSGSFENGVYDYKDLLNKLQQPDSGWKLYGTTMRRQPMSTMSS